MVTSLPPNGLEWKVRDEQGPSSGVGHMAAPGACRHFSLGGLRLALAALFLPLSPTFLDRPIHASKNECPRFGQRGEMV